MTLAAHLEELLMAARVDLPDLANYYDGINGAAHSAGAGSAAIFTTGYGVPSAVHRYWEALCQELEGTLGRTSVALDDCGRALGDIINAYRIEDEAAARELVGLLSNETDPRLRQDPYTHHRPAHQPTTLDPTAPASTPTRPNL
jgi:hypothetical protein